MLASHAEAICNRKEVIVMEILLELQDLPPDAAVEELAAASTLSVGCSCSESSNFSVGSDA